MEEQHRLTMGTNFRFAVAEYARTLGNQVVAGSGNVVDLVAEMVHTAGRVLFQECGDRRCFSQGFK